MNSDYADLAKQDINILSVTGTTTVTGPALVVLYEYKYTRDGNTTKWGKAVTMEYSLPDLPAQILRKVALYREKLEQGE